MSDQTIRGYMRVISDQLDAAAKLPWWRVGRKIRLLLIGQAATVLALSELMPPEPGEDEDLEDAARTAAPAMERHEPHQQE